MEFEIKPAPGDSYKERQWGYTVEPLDQFSETYLYVTTGGTGACWNIQTREDRDDPDDIPLHVCDLDEFIDALIALRDSEAHQLNVARWE